MALVLWRFLEKSIDLMHVVWFEKQLGQKSRLRVKA